MEVSRIDKKDLHEALALVRDVFMEFEAPEYSAEGVAEFLKFIEHDAIAERMDKGTLRLWGCFADGVLAGVIAVRDFTHICLLFVKKEYHRRGIARRLFETCLPYFREAGKGKVLVNSSPYAAEAYRRMGFTPTDKERTVNGIRFVPMEYRLAKH